MKTLALLVFSYLPMIYELKWANNSKPKGARVCMLAHSTQCNQVSLPVKIHYAILYGSRVMAIFAN